MLWINRHRVGRGLGLTRFMIFSARSLASATSPRSAAAPPCSCEILAKTSRRLNALDSSRKCRMCPLTVSFACWTVASAAPRVDPSSSGLDPESAPSRAPIEFSAAAERTICPTGDSWSNTAVYPPRSCLSLNRTSLTCWVWTHSLRSSRANWNPKSANGQVRWVAEETNLAVALCFFSQVRELTSESRELVESTIGLVKKTWRDAACGFWRGEDLWPTLFSFAPPVRTSGAQRQNVYGRGRREKVIGESGKIAGEGLGRVVPGRWRLPPWLDIIAGPSAQPVLQLDTSVLLTLLLSLPLSSKFLLNGKGRSRRNDGNGAQVCRGCGGKAGQVLLSGVASLSFFLFQQESSPSLLLFQNSPSLFLFQNPPSLSLFQRSPSLILFHNSPSLFLFQHSPPLNFPAAPFILVV